MTADARVWRVGIIGMNSAGLFLLERLGLASNTCLVGAFDRDPARLRFAEKFGCELWDRPTAAFDRDDVEVVFLMDCACADTISDAIRHGKHVVLDRPWLLSAGELRSLHEQADSARCVVTVAAIRRWSADFVAASSAKQSGRLGDLRSVRLSSCEQSLPSEPGPLGVIREFGFHYLDQLLDLVESTPRCVFARRLYDAAQTSEHGFLATIEFTNGCTSQIEVQTRTRLSFRTGWMLEGLAGGYRSERVLTTTLDGEIVDEPLLRPELPEDALIEALVAAWGGGRSTLPTLTDAARVVQLIETLERSADSGQTAN